MAARVLHDLIEQRNVERHDRDGGTGLGDQRLVHGDPGLAAERREFAVERALDAFEVLLGLADGAVLVDRPGEFRADVGIGEGMRARGEQSCGEQGVDPHFPILAAHHGHGLGDFVALGRRDGDLIDLAGGGVEGFVSISAGRSV